MSTVIEVVIGMALVYLVAAVAASAINEFAEGLLRRRAGYLDASIKRLTSSDLAENIYNTSWVKSLSTPAGSLKDQRATKNLAQRAIAWVKSVLRFGKGGANSPSYIPSDVFASAIRELMEEAEQWATTEGIDRQLDKILGSETFADAWALVPAGIKAQLESRVKQRYDVKAKESVKAKAKADRRVIPDTSEPATTAAPAGDGATTPDPDNVAATTPDVGADSQLQAEPATPAAPAGDGATTPDPGNVAATTADQGVDGLGAIKVELTNTLEEIVGDLSEFAMEGILELFPVHVLDDWDGRAEELKKWFDTSMDRMSGWYKRQTKWWLILWGALIAFSFNVDSVAITSTLWTDEAVREAAVAAASNYAEENPNCSVDVAGGDDPFKCVDQALDELDDVGTLGMPLGWTAWPWQWDNDVESTVEGEVTNEDGTPVLDENGQPTTAMFTVTTKVSDDPRIPSDGGQVVLKVLGLLATAIAVSFGAPVWFDILNKFVGFRASGAKPQPDAGER